MIDYKQAGVDIEAGDELVRWLQESQPKNQPHQDRLVSGIGGFASLFRIGFSEMKDPCLVTSTDGVGTKIKMANYFQDFSTVGQDLVAMCVNDLICCGAQPLIFLDYYATGKLELENAKSFLGGVRDACIASDCLLIGGETAEMPGVYTGGDFDCAGFAVGVVDREKSLGKHRVEAGHKLVGVASSGFHSNGFSLIRKLFAEDLDNWKKQLLEPTALYSKLALSLAKSDLFEAAAHITGGGIENLLRVMPDGLNAKLKSWTWPEEFQQAQKRSALSTAEMLKTFNCGIGLVLVCQASNVERVVSECESFGFKSFDLGELVAGPEGERTYQFVD